jgi:hypothetical protein
MPEHEIFRHKKEASINAKAYNLTLHMLERQKVSFSMSNLFKLVQTCFLKSQSLCTPMYMQLRIFIKEVNMYTRIILSNLFLKLISTIHWGKVLFYCKASFTIK